MLLPRPPAAARNPPERWYDVELLFAGIRSRGQRRRPCAVPRLFRVPRYVPAEHHGAHRADRSGEPGEHGRVLLQLKKVRVPCYFFMYLI